MWLWRWATRPRWVVWLYIDGERTCAMSAHILWLAALRSAQKLEDTAKPLYPPTWYRIEPTQRPISNAEWCIHR